MGASESSVENAEKPPAPGKSCTFKIKKREILLKGLVESPEKDGGFSKLDEFFGFANGSSNPCFLLRPSHNVAFAEGTVKVNVGQSDATVSIDVGGFVFDFCKTEDLESWSWWGADWKTPLRKSIGQGEGLWSMSRKVTLPDGMELSMEYGGCGPEIKVMLVQVKCGGESWTMQHPFGQDLSSINADAFHEVPELGVKVTFRQKSSLTSLTVQEPRMMVDVSHTAPDPMQSALLGFCLGQFTHPSIALLCLPNLGLEGTLTAVTVQSGSVFSGGIIPLWVSLPFLTQSGPF